MFCVYDIETLRGLFLYVCRNLSTGQLLIFRIDRYRNELPLLLAHLQSDFSGYMVSFNGLGFDSQVITFILRNAQNWLQLPGEQLSAAIYEFSQDLIDDARYGIRPPFKESELWRKQIDLYKLHHYDNDNRRCSLKWLQNSMDLATIEEIPIDHRRPDLSEEEIKAIIRYCIHDVDATTQFFRISRGQTQLELYAGKDKIQDRLDLMAEFRFPPHAMSWSDVKIGDELNKRGYARETGLKFAEIGELKARRAPTGTFTFGDCAPAYIQFKTPALQTFFADLCKQRVELNNDEQEFPIRIGNTIYKIKKGGIHSSEGGRIVEPGLGQYLIDADVGSQYPNAIVKRQLYPRHLGPQWLTNYKNTIQRRLNYKKWAADESLPIDQRRKYKGLAEMLKLALNGGGFGKTNERSNWQYDPFVHFACTIGNQLEMLMLIEELELGGIQVVSANTDGFVALLEKGDQNLFYNICEQWENTVGNSEMGKLEYTYYKKLIQKSVNHYMAVKDNGHVKEKGDFALQKELHGNKSRRVIPLALREYFMHGTPVEKTITDHREIFDFCIGVKATKDFHYETVNTTTGERSMYHRTVRYFVSKPGAKLLKVRNDQRARKAKVLQCEAGTWLSTIYNEAQSDFPVNIDYHYYIQKAKEIIRSIETPAAVKKTKHVNVAPNQLSIF